MTRRLAVRIALEQHAHGRPGVILTAETHFRLRFLKQRIGRTACIERAGRERTGERIDRTRRLVLQQQAAAEPIPGVGRERMVRITRDQVLETGRRSRVVGSTQRLEGELVALYRAESVRTRRRCSGCDDCGRGRRDDGRSVDQRCGGRGRRRGIELGQSLAQRELLLGLRLEFTAQRSHLGGKFIEPRGEFRQTLPL